MKLILLTLVLVVTVNCNGDHHGADHGHHGGEHGHPAGGAAAQHADGHRDDKSLSAHPSHQEKSTKTTF